nr:EOG090X0AZ6 [Macrothrix elegans]
MTNIFMSLDSSQKKLAIIVPFRNRFDELLKFLPYMHRFLKNQSVPHEFFIVNQQDENRFNRASLINAGFLLSTSSNKFQYIAMHDVDLLPNHPDLRYDYPGHGFALHIASPKYHPKYHYDTFVGGILLLTVEDFRKLNGLSNRYWGWGLEDDEFYLRMKQGGISVLRPNVTDNTEKEGSYKNLLSILAYLIFKIQKFRNATICYDANEIRHKRRLHTSYATVVFQLHFWKNMAVSVLYKHNNLLIHLYLNNKSYPCCTVYNLKKNKIL